MRQKLRQETGQQPRTEEDVRGARVDQAPALDGQDGGPIGEFFTALGPGWRLTGAPRTKLAAGGRAAVNAGWTPRALAAITGANTSGVRNPYAVLAVRLSAAELPPPPGQRPPRPPWCSECDERTRMAGFY